MSLKKRPWILILIAALLVFAAPAAMPQGTYPNKPIRIIVPWTPAGTTDIAARYLAVRLSARLGQTVIIENRAGATGQIGSQLVAHAPPDGYTLLLMSATVHTVSPNLSKSFPFDPIDDFTPISQIVSFPYVMVVSASSPYRSVADLTSAAKKEPGKIAYGSFGLGSAPYVISKLLGMSTGAQFLHVPYKGAAQALTDIAGGQITFFIDSLPSPLGQIRGGRLRALAVTTPQRSAILPEVPTIAETVPGFEAIAWLGIAAPAKTPRDIVTKLHEQLKEIAAEAEYGAKLRDIGLEPVASASPEQFRAWLVSQKEYWGKVVRDAKIPLVD
jgi:tripartite-type tricarboxylate transporter receptor subunit TctC